ncbi:MAG: hypothetical protein IT462_08425 [Planctomycetes bacterium]|nr:hypothetical protein [Planctomycetota bacterium]
MNDLNDRYSNRARSDTPENALSDAVESAGRNPNPASVAKLVLAAVRLVNENDPRPPLRVPLWRMLPKILFWVVSLGLVTLVVIAAINADQRRAARANAANNSK